MIESIENCGLDAYPGIKVLTDVEAIKSRAAMQHSEDSLGMGVPVGYEFTPKIPTSEDVNRSFRKCSGR
ncbi:MAG: hypothetical protein QF381_03005 [Nitrososphaerales archaeon]|jgi:hypothetical protein|nr:hypothetical protein [Nitrososphaerales archaeon]